MIKKEVIVKIEKPGYDFNDFEDVINFITFVIHSSEHW